MSVNKKKPSVEIDESISTLSALQKIGYGFGHVFNDLCGTLWFSYCLLFFKYIVNIPAEAGALMMLGQLSDAFFSAFIGLLTDLYSTKRNWHIIGSIVVFLSFPMIFILQRNILPYWGTLFYFFIMIIFFQCGWATVQISHLAIIPEYSNTEKDRSELNAVRFSFTILSNISVFIVAFIFLKGKNPESEEIGSEEFEIFRNIILILTLCGGITTILFHISLSCNSNYTQRRREKKTESSLNGNNDDIASSKTLLVIMNVLTNLELYKVAFLYTFSRLFLLNCLFFIPIWINELMKMKTGQLDTTAIAITPLILFASSFAVAILLKFISQDIPQEVVYSVGSFISIFGCIIIALTRSMHVIELYVIALLLGAGSSFTQVSSLSISSNFIGKNCKNSGLVYSIVTVCDKIFSGIIVFIIEIFGKGKDSTYYTNVLIFNATIPLIALIVLFMLRK
ncbi:hypothetical protein PVAND_008597 [Polypedilum vanderplanki]|uniref:Uncharacterized protein n=1 Tax=Polypedilum vanderplanki TaxID=319348 RepID=A0A9J6CB67_POLVA|nr:hypothetical protein PVAND_008597 [Polypedilum vanderplanki]